MDWIDHIYGGIGLCGRQTQTDKKNTGIVSGTFPANQRAVEQEVCTLNTGEAE